MKNSRRYMETVLMSCWPRPSQIVWNSPNEGAAKYGDTWLIFHYSDQVGEWYLRHELATYDGWFPMLQFTYQNIIVGSLRPHRALIEGSEDALE